MKSIVVHTGESEELVDITQRVQEQIDVERSACYLFVLHTTAAVTVNENADPDVKTDILRGLDRMIPQINYEHVEGNSPAHIKASLIGPDMTVLIENGEVVLGTWQGIYLCEFDGPRERELHVMTRPA